MATELSLSAYLGMSIDSLVKQGNSPSKIKNLVNSLLIEEAIKLTSDDESKSIDYYGIKPLFVAIKFILDNELSKLMEVPDEDRLPAMNEEIYRLEFITEYLESRIQGCKEKEE